jgi:Na+-translocating ferredoxin:NAD+ oxidoreductase RnfE subunit
MQRLFTMFPLGAAGSALLLLRMSAAGGLLWVMYTRNLVSSAQWMMAASAILAGFLSLGIFTPVVCIVCCGVELAAVAGMRRTDIFCDIFVIANTAALALLGPGGYSLDARMFGRRRIILSGDDNSDF